MLFFSSLLYGLDFGGDLCFGEALEREWWNEGNGFLCFYGEDSALLQVKEMTIIIE